MKLYVLDVAKLALSKLKKTKLKPVDDSTKTEGYYEMLEVLELQVKNGIISEKLFLNFKTMIRNYKYISIYIKSLSKNFEGINSIEDFNNKMEKFRVEKDWDLQPSWLVRNLLELRSLSDPVVIIKSVLNNAIEREGKICDWRDSVNPETRFGFCEDENHDGDRVKQVLYLTLYIDSDAAKLDDTNTAYVCKDCFDGIENDGEVSCDMG